MAGPADSVGREMNSAVFQTVYDGEALREHTIDVEQLAPAMLALGELVREANASINGDRSKVKLLVKANHENRCFDVGFELIQTFYSQIKTLLGDEQIKDAKELLEWLGIIATPSIGLFAFLKFRKGRRVADLRQITDVDKRGMVSIRFEGDDNRIEVHNHVYDMSENKRILSATTGALAPLKTEGIDSVEFRSEDSGAVKYDKDDATDIETSCQTDEVEEDYEPQEIEARLEIYGPIFDVKAEAWRFNYGGDHIYADITETSIAQDAIERGRVSVGDMYRVKMEITEYRTPTKQLRKKYKILEVLDFIPAVRQPSLFDSGGDNGAR